MPPRQLERLSPVDLTAMEQAPKVSLEKKEGLVRWTKYCADNIRRHAKEQLGIDGPFDMLITLGSGMNELADKMDFADSIEIDDDVLGLPVPVPKGEKLKGHENKTILAVTKSGKKVALKKGRIHPYQVPVEGIDDPNWGHLTQEEIATEYLRAFDEVGVDNVILTTAAGGIANPTNPGQPPTFGENAHGRVGVVVGSDIGFSYNNPNMGGNQKIGSGERFTVHRESDRTLIDAFNRTRKNLFGARPSPELVYATSLSLPNYEDREEVYSLVMNGVQLAGMTITPEVQVISNSKSIKKFMALAVATNIIELLPEGGDKSLISLKLQLGIPFSNYDYHRMQAGLSLIPSVEELRHYKATDLKLASVASHEEVVAYGEKYVPSILVPELMELIENLPQI